MLTGSAIYFGLLFYSLIRRIEKWLQHMVAPVTVVWKDNLDLQIVQGIWLGPWLKAPIGELEFIKN